MIYSVINQQVGEYEYQELGIEVWNTNTNEPIEDHLLAGKRPG